MSETHIHRAGIVDRVAAKRKGSDVISLAITVRFDTMLVNEYNYGDNTQIDEVTFHIPPAEGVNPGDVVIMNLSFKSPFGQRFVPALEVGEDIEDVETYELTDEEGDATLEDADVDA
jgi:hypothetical protein